MQKCERYMKHLSRQYACIYYKIVSTKHNKKCGKKKGFIHPTSRPTQGGGKCRLQLLQGVIFQSTIYIISRAVRGVKYIVIISVFDIVIQSHVLIYGNNTTTQYSSSARRSSFPFFPLILSDTCCALHNRLHSSH
jgi:hypothetical protein